MDLLLAICWGNLFCAGPQLTTGPQRIPLRGRQPSLAAADFWFWPPDAWPRSPQFCPHIRLPPQHPNCLISVSDSWTLPIPVPRLRILKLIPDPHPLQFLAPWLPDLLVPNPHFLTPDPPNLPPWFLSLVPQSTVPQVQPVPPNQAPCLMLPVAQSLASCVQSPEPLIPAPCLLSPVQAGIGWDSNTTRSLTKPYTNQ